MASTKRQVVGGLLAGVATGLAIFAAMLPPDAPVLYCDRCEHVRPTVEIVYGLPGEKLLASARRGEVVLGGCMVQDFAPVRACGTCREPITSWGHGNWLTAITP